MIDKDEQEVDAISNGAAAMGDYIESVCKTDLSDYTRDEFLLLAECCITGFLDTMRGTQE